MRKTRFQPSESFTLGILLAISGGFWDTYTYILRGEVFANAETGNIVLLGINIATGNFKNAINYLVPILAFALGVFIIGLIRRRFRDISVFHWRHIIITIEILIVFCVGFMPEALNHLVNVLVSFVCAMQVATFKKVWDCPCATTMCTGNLRSCTENLFQYLNTKDKKFLRKSFTYFGVIMFFILGALLGTVCSLTFGIKAIWITCLILLMAYPVMKKNFLHRHFFNIKYKYLKLTRRLKN
ncbi:MAG: YoaK family protein [Lachnospirales bacterium]